MKKLIAILIFNLFLAQIVTAKITQINPNKQQKKELNTTRPNLVVGIVIDQMRYDYLVKFYSKFSEDGFKRLINNGYNLKNVHFNYIPTYTAVGHTSIYTGTTPNNHGIISNDWYDKYLKKAIYCVDDSNYKTVGAQNGGDKSPYRLLTTTITDQLKLAQNMQGKVIGISLKDRAAILPAGHVANAAYWFEGNDEGKFITSTFYENQLPTWVINFNNSGKANAYLNQTWNTFFDINSYTESLPDNNKFEGLFKGKKTPTFPYNLSELRKNNDNYNLLKEVPFGNSITTDFAEAAINGENLGKSNVTDFLAISYSSTDYIGHKFGTDAVELEDTYIRLDRDLARLFTFLDKNIGKDNYTLFLTADHAAIPVPAYLNSLKLPGGYFDSKGFKKYVDQISLENFKTTDIVEDISNNQIYLNRDKIKELNLNLETVEQTFADEIMNFSNVYKAVTAYTLQTTSFTSGVLQSLQNGYNQKLSGDVLFIPYPATITHSKTGTTHGSGFNYDTHVPLLFYGKGIKKGSSNVWYPIIDIAPTLSSLLNITEPDGCTGTPILEVIK